MHFFTAVAPINNEEEEKKVERVLEDVVPFLGTDRVDVTDAIRLAAVLPSDDDSELAPENISDADQPPPPQGQWGHNNICDNRCSQYPCFTLDSKGAPDHPILTF